MCTISIKVPNEILLGLHETQHGFTQYMKQMIAIDLYKNKKISLGYCAELAEMTKEDFINLLSKHEVSIFSFESEEEFKEELENA